jgi:hypothetical protein
MLTDVMPQPVRMANSSHIAGILMGAQLKIGGNHTE